MLTNLKQNWISNSFSMSYTASSVMFEKEEKIKSHAPAKWTGKQRVKKKIRMEKEQEIQKRKIDQACNDIKEG